MELEAINHNIKSKTVQLNEKLSEFY